MVLALHEDDRLVRFGQLEGRGQPGDAAADDEGGRVHVDEALLQRFVMRHAADGRPGQGGGLVGGGARVLVDPAALLADVGHLQEVGVEPGRGEGAAEGRLVHPRAAGGHHHAVEALLPDVLGDHLLARVGAHVLVGAGHRHAGQVLAALRTTSSQSTTLAMLVPQLQT